MTRDRARAAVLILSVGLAVTVMLSLIPRAAAAVSVRPATVPRLLPEPPEASVAAPAGPGVAPAAGFRWPLDGAPRPVRRFDPPPQPWSPGHRGVDLAAAPGAVVRAAGAGTVYFAGLVAGRPVVSVAHPGGLRTTYEPVRPAVATGDPVAAGDPLGVLLAGHPGCPAGACLHWGLRRGDEYLDPLALLGLGRVRLLPVRASRRRRSQDPGDQGVGGRRAADTRELVPDHGDLGERRAGRRRARRSYSAAWL